MDHFKLIKEMQGKFRQRPRQSIKEFLAHQKQSVQDLKKLPLALQNISVLKNVYNEYAQLLGKLIEHNILNPNKMRNIPESVGIVQRVNEGLKTISDHNQNQSETTALRLSKVYASFLEIIWKKLKRYVHTVGLNPKQKHLDIRALLRMIETIEREYSISVPHIKSYLDAELRNFIGHESTLFKPPNYIYFLKPSADDLSKSKKVTTDELKKRILESMTVLVAFVLVENSVVAVHLKPLLNLTDDELDEYMKTGVITNEMRNKMYPST